jgi:hypothetical protein
MGWLCPTASGTAAWPARLPALAAAAAAVLFVGKNGAGQYTVQRVTTLS